MEESREDVFIGVGPKMAYLSKEDETNLSRH